MTFEVVQRPNVVQLFFLFVVRPLTFNRLVSQLVLLSAVLVIKLADQAVVSHVGVSTLGASAVIHQSKADIAFLVNQDRQRVPVGYQHPLPYVELFAIYYQGVLYILLNHPMAAFVLFYVL